jgi:Outer membrane protein
MKKTNYLLKGIIGIAFLAFFISCNKQAGESETLSAPNENSIPLRLPVAYVDTDSLLVNYQFVVDKNEEILKKLEDSRLNIGKQYEKFQKEVLDYQEKVQRNLYMSKERAQQEETSLRRKEQEIENSAAKAEQEIAMERTRFQQSLQDSLDLGIRDFNNGKYQIIFSNASGSTFLYMDESYDITKEVVDFLNARYTPEKK